MIKIEILTVLTVSINDTDKNSYINKKIQPDQIPIFTIQTLYFYNSEKTVWNSNQNICSTNNNICIRYWNIYNNDGIVTIKFIIQI